MERTQELLYQGVSTIATQGYAEESDWGAGAVRSKKPFCNAFTGCGRKRADPDMETEELMQLLAARVQGIRDQVSRHNVKVEEL